MTTEQYEVQWKDYYQILGVRPDADAETIQRMWRRLSQVYHPDVAGDAAIDPERMHDLNEAREVLSDPERRARYNSAYRTRQTEGGSAAGATATEEPRSRRAPDQQSSWNPPPIPNLSPDHADLGIVSPDKMHSATFWPANLGGPADQIAVEYSPDESWLTVTTEGDNFPSPIHVAINPRLLQPGREYVADLALTLDGVTASASIRFQVASAVSTYRDREEDAREPSDAWIADLTRRFPPLRILESLADAISPNPDETQRIFPSPSWRWQRLALLGSIPMTILLIFASVASAAWFLLALSVIWLAVTVYAGIVTDWLRSSRAALGSAKIAGGIAIVASGIVYGVVIGSIIVWGVIMLFFFRIGAALLKNWRERAKSK